jgi:hypothetical protein
MNKSTLASAQPVIDSIVNTQNETKKSLEHLVERETIAHDAVNVLQKKIVALIRAYRKACIGKSIEDREATASLTFDKIEETLTQDVSSLRDKVWYDRGKIDAFSDTTATIQSLWTQAVADEIRVEEVAALILSGEEPNNGKERKPGTRPEKTAVVRKAQKIVAESPQEE